MKSTHSIVSAPDPVTVFVVEEQANPSTDYFVLPALQSAGHRIVHCGFADLPEQSNLVGAMVVFVRYVPTAWARLVEAARSDLQRLAFFMDDDVLDVSASAGMSWRYRFKLARLAAWRRAWLRRQRAELWVSTRWLQNKYSSWQPRLLQPMPLLRKNETCRVFYHGTASHDAEIRWLKPVMAAALEREARLVFEIVGGADVYRLYRDLPRVNVIHPMKWPAYQAFLDVPGRQIGLAPLLDIPFNRARSCTKFFDITRCGAAGIYSSESACDELVTHGVDGLLLPIDQQVWMDAILRLASDEALRQALLRNAVAKQVTLGGNAQI